MTRKRRKKKDAEEKMDEMTLELYVEARNQAKKRKTDYIR